MFFTLPRLLIAQNSKPTLIAQYHPSYRHHIAITSPFIPSGFPSGTLSTSASSFGAYVPYVKQNIQTSGWPKKMGTRSTCFIDKKCYNN